MTLKLALLGKDIGHSLSPKVYQELLPELSLYDLLDFKTVAEIPALNDLLKKYDGINVTAPYKNIFSKEIINCVKKTPQGYLTANTDILAADEMLQIMLKQFKKIEVALLGDGCMSLIYQAILKKYNIPFIICSRKLTPEFNSSSFFPAFQTVFQKIIVNACSRSMLYAGQGDKKVYFYDLNYAMPEHLLKLPNLFLKYQDGEDFLRKQASHSLQFFLSS